MKYLLFAGSLRTESLNKKLVTVASKLMAAKTGTEVNVVNIRDFNIPVYDGDIEEKNGIPDGVKAFAELIAKANALIISAPEYNGSIAGPLKNAIDWVSRVRPVPFEGKPILLLGATPGGFGAIRGLAATKVPLEALGSVIYPQTFGVPKAHEFFSKEGELTDAGTKTRLSGILDKFDIYAKRFQ